MISLFLSLINLFSVQSEEISQNPNYSYKDGFIKALDDSSFVTMLFWGVGIFFGIILLFIIAVALKKIYDKRVKSIQVVGMDYRDLDRMKRTGLLSDSELAVVKKKMAENFLKRSQNAIENENINTPVLQANSDGEISPKNEGQTLPNTKGSAAATDDLSVAQPTSAPLAKATLDLEQYNKPSEKKSENITKIAPKARQPFTPINLKTLLEQDLITRQEYEEFTELFAKLRGYPKIN